MSGIRPKRYGRIYVIQFSTGVVKVGCTTDVVSRMMRYRMEARVMLASVEFMPGHRVDDGSDLYQGLDTKPSIDVP